MRRPLRVLAFLWALTVAWPVGAQEPTATEHATRLRVSQCVVVGPGAVGCSSAAPVTFLGLPSRTTETLCVWVNASGEAATGACSPSGHTHDGSYQPLDSDLSAIASLSVSRGGLIYGNSTPAWEALSVGTGVLVADGTDVTGWTQQPTLSAINWTNSHTTASSIGGLSFTIDNGQSFGVAAGDAHFTFEDGPGGPSMAIASFDNVPTIGVTHISTARGADIVLGRMRGSFLAPRRVQSGDVVGRFSVRGAYAANDSSDAQFPDNGFVFLQAVAAQSYTATAIGTKVEGYYIPLNSTTATLGWTLGADGVFDFESTPTVDGDDIYHVDGTDVALADGGTGASLTDPNADRILFWDESAGAVTWLTAGTGLSISSTTLSQTGAGDVVSITFIIDGGGSTITTGIKGDLEIPFACTINQATALIDQSGAIVVDIWKDSYANYPPTDADSITASAPVTISASGVKSQDSTLSGWTTSIGAGDTLRFNVDSVTSATRATISLKCTKT